MSRRLLFLNGLATLGVVINHAAGWGYVAMFWWTSQYRAVSVPNFDQLGSASYFGLRLMEQLISYTIPSFLFVSGFFAAFAAGKSNTTVSWGFVRQRITYLVIPYLFWVAVMLASDFVQGQTYPLRELPGLILLGKITPAFYFVPLLVQFYLLAPLLVRLARDRARLLLIAAAIIQLTVHAIRYGLILQLPFAGREALSNLTPGWLFLGNIFWFSLGIAMGFHYQTLRPMLARCRWLFLGALILLLPLGMVEWEGLLRASGQGWLTPKHTLLDDLFGGAFILSLVAFERVRYPATKLLAELGTKSFGIYLVHTLALTYTAKIIYHVLPGLLAYQWLLQPVLLAAGLGIPLLLMAIVNHSPARRLYAYQFG